MPGVVSAGKHEERSKFFRLRSPGRQAAGNEMKYLLDHEPTEEETTWVLEFFRSLKTIVFKDHRQGPFDHIVARYAAGHQAVPENLGLFLHLGHVSSAVSNVEWMSCEPLRYHDNRQCRWVCSIRWFSAQVPRAAPNSCSRACSVVYMYTLRIRRYGGMT